MEKPRVIIELEPDGNCRTRLEHVSITIALGMVKHAEILILRQDAMDQAQRAREAAENAHIASTLRKGV